MYSIFGTPVVVSPLMDGFRKPRIRPMPPLPYLDESVRAGFNLWLLEMFGDDECVLMIDDKMFVSEHTLQMIQLKAGSYPMLNLNTP